MNGQVNSEVVKKTSSNRWARTAKMFGIGYIAALFTGVIYGILLRLVMGIIAYFFPQLASGFHFSGTLLIVTLGIVVTLANSIVYTSLFHRSRKSWVVKGLLFGLFLLIIYGIPLFMPNPNSELFGPQAPLGIALFSVSFFIGSVILALLFEYLSKWVDQSKGRLKLAYVSFVILSIPAIIMLVAIYVEMFTETLPQILNN
ncbi:hypothetical protein M3610_26505 [Neobacillus sp. MER 74]|uniref:hypothetical protein n=1 Tax=Neobacillus sp. MER 74 TaxID=2939566 RepID=UPI00203CF9D2|nr:hypothetical protein [Neobacillus sp. MER 74]MCM3118739.1 hypothetical protein [Neobacillus sp. MER 74]HWL25147.1 hypothetical protein [Ureibacillus sp.]